MNKKGQIILLVSMLAAFAFMLAFAMFFDYLMVSPRVSTDEYNFILQENSRLADTILQPGVPLNWDRDTVLKIGIVDGNILNTTKAEYFEDLSREDHVDQTGYEEGKTLLGLFYEYLIIIEKENDILYSIGDYIDLGITEGSIEEDDLVGSNPAAISIQERTVLHRDEGRLVPVKIKIYTYKK